ncbi:MAG: hypothetical protein Q9207_003494 [Kuettlingeria erythrocarpa]
MPEAHDAHHNVLEAAKQDFTGQNIANEPAEGVNYYTPAQVPPAGTASDPQPDGSHPPKLFQPLKLRGLTLQNRIMLSPLCQYSAEDGHHTAWHQTHLGGIIQRGPGLAMVEATASTVAPWLARSAVATKDVNGWPDNVLAPSDIAYSGLANPKAMTKDDIASLKESWVAAVQRAVKIGFDVIEVHNAHGYLLHSFLSPASNKRTDEYGGSFENRIRLTLEIVELTRKNIPEDMPLFLRISATDWLENEEGMDSWKLEDTVRLAEMLASRGVDLLDVSSGGLHPSQKIKGGPGYQAPFAQQVKEKVRDRMMVGTVGSITNGKQANELLEKGLDLAIVGRYFQKNPGLVWSFAEDLGVEINVANQIRWGFGGRTLDELEKERENALVEKKVLQIILDNKKI